MNPQSIWTPFIATPRDEILDRVRTGALTPEQAEIEAKAGGFGPLESKPDAACYDPMRQVWWSLPMVAAWVGWRNFNAVRRAWTIFDNAGQSSVVKCARNTFLSWSPIFRNLRCLEQK